MCRMDILEEIIILFKNIRLNFYLWIHDDVSLIQYDIRLLAYFKVCDKT